MAIHDDMPARELKEVYAARNGAQTIETRIGPLEFTHDFANGFPTDETVEKLYDSAGRTEGRQWPRGARGATGLVAVRPSLTALPRESEEALSPKPLDLRLCLLECFPSQACLQERR